MENEIESRHIFLTFGIGVIVIAPIILIFIPTVIANSLYGGDSVWIVQLPDGTYWVYGLACLLVALSPFLISIMDVSKKSVLLSILVLLASIPMFLFAAQPYEAIGNDGISYQKPFSFTEQHYSWDEVDTVVRHMGNNDEQYYGYEITFKDGTVFMIDDNKNLTAFRRMMNNTLQLNKIEIDIR